MEKLFGIPVDGLLTGLLLALAVAAVIVGVLAVRNPILVKLGVSQRTPPSRPQHADRRRAHARDDDRRRGAHDRRHDEPLDSRRGGAGPGSDRRGRIAGRRDGRHRRRARRLHRTQLPRRGDRRGRGPGARGHEPGRRRGAGDPRRRRGAGAGQPPDRAAGARLRQRPRAHGRLLADRAGRGRAGRAVRPAGGRGLPERGGRRGARREGRRDAASLRGGQAGLRHGPRRRHVHRHGRGRPRRAGSPDRRPGAARPGRPDRRRDDLEPRRHRHRRRALGRGGRGAPPARAAATTST